MIQNVKLKLVGLGCANCANKMEERVKKLPGVQGAQINFATSTLVVDFEEENKEELLAQISTIVNEIEPGVIVEEVVKTKRDRNRDRNKEEHSHEHEDSCGCGCGHEHHHEHEEEHSHEHEDSCGCGCGHNHNHENETIQSNTETVSTKGHKILLKGLDCANCANKVENKIKQLKEVKSASVNFATTSMTVELVDGIRIEEYMPTITKVVNQAENGIAVILMDAKQKVEKMASDERKGIASYVKENTTLLIGALLFVASLLLQQYETVSFIGFSASYLMIGSSVLRTAARNISHGEIFDENFLMAIATIGAFAIGEFPEAVAVMLFFEVGEAFQSYAVNKSRKSISSLMDIRAEYATVLENGSEVQVTPEEVEIGEFIVIKPGERVPLDGIVLEGSSFLDTSALTGESVPREVNRGEEILAGSINNTGVLKVKVTKEYGESTVARILELVENATSKKAETEKFITRFSKVYTPIVCAISLVVAILPPLLIPGATFTVWIYRALALLVVSCPCALVVSVPLGIFAGLGGASKKGVLIKGGNYLEALKDVETVVFDKTGTLTKGVFKVTSIHAQGIDQEELLKVAAYGESQSNHPIAKSIQDAYGKEIDKSKIREYTEISGHGIQVVIDDKTVLLGNEKLMKENNIAYKQMDTIGTMVYVAIENSYKGCLIISDEIKENAKEALAGLKKAGVKNTIMLTGDNRVVAEKVAGLVGVDQVYAELLPAGKVEQVEHLFSKKSKAGKIAFVGDGINDAPVLARADIGIAMGGIGSDAAIEAADVVLMKDDPQAIQDAIKVARKTNRILWQNILFALGIKTVVMILVAIGMGNMWEAVFADVGVTILAVLNSIRCLNVK
ncbi:MAG: heavy metal translocating P-type ATPase [bacterium]|nr:heavy metal translocating P-type ATPase [bacterium]